MGIYVTTVCPGPVDTPFFNIAEKYEKELLAVGNRYSEVMKNGIEYLRNAVKIHTVRERILSSFTDYGKIDKISKIICVD